MKTNKKTLKNKIYENFGLIAFFGVLVIVMLYWCDSVKAYNENIDRCGSNYCQVEK